MHKFGGTSKEKHSPCKWGFRGCLTRCAHKEQPIDIHFGSIVTVCVIKIFGLNAIHWESFYKVADSILVDSSGFFISSLIDRRSKSLVFAGRHERRGRGFRWLRARPAAVRDPVDVCVVRRAGERGALGALALSAFYHCSIVPT